MEVAKAKLPQCTTLITVFCKIRFKNTISYEIRFEIRCADRNQRNPNSDTFLELCEASSLYLFQNSLCRSVRVINVVTMQPVKSKKTFMERLISVIFNRWFWDFVYKRILYFLFPSMDKTIKLLSPPLDAALVGLDGSTKYSLLNDFINKTPANMPLVINMGSYN